MNNLQDVGASSRGKNSVAIGEVLDIDSKLRAHAEHQPNKLAVADSSIRMT